MSGGHCSLHVSLPGNSCHSSLACFALSRLLPFHAVLCPVLQIRPELIGRDGEAPTAAGIIGAVLSVVLPVLFFQIPFGGKPAV